MNDVPVRHHAASFFRPSSRPYSFAQFSTRFPFLEGAWASSVVSKDQYESPRLTLSLVYTRNGRDHLGDYALNSETSSRLQTRLLIQEAILLVQLRKKRQQRCRPSWFPKTGHEPV